MATYTDNYQLTKPTYAEQADIGVINSNMNIIDDIMHSSQVSLAPAYDQSQTYAEGDVVMYELLMYKCIAPTTGVWDGSKWERTTASESGGGGTAELDILGEGNGAVVSFADGASAELAKCIAEIVPKQDLHGYDKPWAGGVGKNKCPFNITDIKTRNTDGTWTGNNYTINNVVVSVLTDTDGNITGFKYNGTANAAFGFNLTANNLTLPSGSYIWSIQETVDINNLWVSIYNPNSVAIVAKTQTEVNYTCNGSFGGAYIYTNSGNTFDNVVFQPMLRLSSETDVTFEPYSNICPISGSTSVTVTVSDGETSTTKTTPLGQTVYGGQLNVLTGLLTITNGYIASYNGETLTSTWISDRDEYAPNTSPTTGAQVVYPLATPQIVQLTPQEVNSLLGQNNISADTGDIDIVYVKASAPIQPNPTGTPTATLKKLGIEGTVFELEDGGGGSSSGIVIDDTERVVGTYFGKPLYQKTYSFSDVTITSGGSVIIATLMQEIIVNGYGYIVEGATRYVIPDIALRIKQESSSVKLMASIGASWNISEGSLTIQYTKITD